MVKLLSKFELSKGIMQWELEAATKQASSWSNNSDEVKEMSAQDQAKARMHCSLKAYPSPAPVAAAMFALALAETALYAFMLYSCSRWA